MSAQFLQSLLNETKNDFAMTADDEEFGDYEFIDTGSYALNALVSGSIYGGIADTKVIGLAGEEATGKSFFALANVKSFLNKYPDGMVAIFESENAIDRETIVSRGIDPKRVAIIPVGTIEEFRTQAARMLDKYLEQSPKSRPRLMFVLDSLGNLSTSKEVTDIAEGNDKRDMTRQQLARGAFRVLTLKMGRARVPIVVTNHIYMAPGAYGDPRVIAGGGGMKYAASTILMLSKAQFKEGEEKMGNIITCRAVKSRFTRDGKKVEVLLHHTRGLDRYYGLLDFAIASGVCKKSGKQYEFADGEKVFESRINANPERYYTKERLDIIDAWCKTEFNYGEGEAPAAEEDDGDAE